MTEYIIDIIIDNIRENDYGNTKSEKLYVKIDKNGNVDIKKQYKHHRVGIKDEYGSIFDVLIINDNVSIPSYMIEVLKKLFSPPNSTRYLLHANHYENVIESLKILKENIVKSEQKLIDLI